MMKVRYEKRGKKYKWYSNVSMFITSIISFFITYPPEILFLDNPIYKIFVFLLSILFLLEYQIKSVVEIVVSDAEYLKIQEQERLDKIKQKRLDKLNKILN